MRGCLQKVEGEWCLLLHLQRQLESQERAETDPPGLLLSFFGGVSVCVCLSHACSTDLRVY